MLPSSVARWVIYLVTIGVLIGHFLAFSSSLVTSLPRSSTSDISKDNATSLSVSNDTEREAMFAVVVACCGNDWACPIVGDFAAAFPPDFSVTFLRDPKRADVAIRSAWGSCKEGIAEKSIFKDPDFRHIYINMEPHKGYEYSSTGQFHLVTVRPGNPKRLPEEQNRIMYMPYAAAQFSGRHFMKEELLRTSGNFSVDGILEHKKRFCAFMSRYCVMDLDVSLNAKETPVPEEHDRYGEVRFRLLWELSKSYKEVSSLGICSRNEQIPKDFPEGVSSREDETIHIYRPYKFVFAVENQRVDGYLTEKLMNARLANAVPIYWGDPSIAEMINTDSIIHCEPDGEWPDIHFSTCIQEIRELDGDDEAYKAKLAEPLFKDPDTLPHWMQMSTYAGKVANIWRSELKKQHVDSSVRLIRDIDVSRLRDPADSIPPQWRPKRNLIFP